MRKILFQSLARAPLTEPAPIRTIRNWSGLPLNKQRGGGQTRAQSGDPACRCRLLQRLRTRNPCAQHAFYDIERFGLKFVASPRHADILLVTGP